MGNLADELDQLDEDMDVEEDNTETTMNGLEDDEREPSPVDGARDSGIDVSYVSKGSSPQVKNFSKPFTIREKPPEEATDPECDKLSPELEDAMNNISRMASYTSTIDDPLIPRTLVALQDLGNQSTLEANVQRFTISTNSMTSHLTAQSKSVQALATSLYTPFVFSMPLDVSILEEAAPLIDALLHELPLPDPAPLTGLRKLDRDTHDVINTLSHLTDTLQMGKQVTNTASRHLRTTQMMVAELRRERERAESARFDLEKAGWDEKVRQRWCAGECKDIMSGFESTCQALRANLECASVGAG